MKRWTQIITRHWRAKLVSLLLAVAVWLLIHQAITEETASSVQSSPPVRRTAD